MTDSWAIKPVDTKWVDIFREMETKTYKSKILLLLGNKILSIPCSNTFIEQICSLMSSHWTDARNHCNVGLSRAGAASQSGFHI